MKNKLMTNLLTLSTIVLLLAAAASAQKYNAAPKSLTKDGRYVVMQTVKIKKAFEKMDGQIEILRDARLTDDVSVMQSNNGSSEPFLESNDPKLKEMFEQEEFRPGLLRLMGAKGEIFDSVELECLFAEVKRVYLYSAARPSYEITCRYTNEAPYGGDETFFYDLKNTRLARLAAFDRKTGEKVPMEFTNAHRSGWRYQAAGRGAKDILSVVTGWQNIGENDGDFYLRYERFHFDGRRWVRYERRVDGEAWEDEFGFPKTSLFPKA